VVLPLRIHTDPKRPNTVTVKDANGIYVGLIHYRFGYWGNYPESRAAGVALGPFRSMEAAFEAFRSALGNIA
jgi:hypothetical protein